MLYFYYTFLHFILFFAELQMQPLYRHFIITTHCRVVFCHFSNACLQLPQL